MGIPFGYCFPANFAGYFRPAMSGICVAVNATTWNAELLRYTMLKLWKSRPAAPIMMVLIGAITCPFLKSIITVFWTGTYLYSCKNKPNHSMVACSAGMRRTTSATAATWTSMVAKVKRPGISPMENVETFFWTFPPEQRGQMIEERSVWKNTTDQTFFGNPDNKIRI